MGSRIAAPELAEEGERSYRWAYEHMPTLTRTIRKLEGQRPLEGLTVGVCLHVTKETSVLVMGLKRLGADIHLAAANPLSTQNGVAAYLASQGVNVYAWRGETAEEYQECIRSMLRGRPSIVLDDGADTHVTIHKEGEFSGLEILGGTEETTTGIVRLKALEKEGRLRYPVIGVNNAYTKFLFDNRYGTGQSTIDGILRATSLLLAGKRIVVCGYGWVGRGIAMRARGMGGIVTVVEVDPFKALEARMDGYDVLPIREAAKVGDIFITATGQINVIRGEHIKAMKDGAVLANAGHFNVEIDIDGLEDEKERKTTVRPNVEEYLLKDGRRIYLIGEGRVVNLTAAEGHPPEVMSLSFSNQLLSTVYIAKHSSRLEKRVNEVPMEIDRQVALNALESLGVEIDSPTEEQIRYAESWLI